MCTLVCRTGYLATSDVEYARCIAEALDSDSPLEGSAVEVKGEGEGAGGARGMRARARASARRFSDTAFSSAVLREFSRVLGELR